MAISSTLIVLATCGRIFFTTTTMMMVEEKSWANKPRKTAILTCLAVSRMAEISVAFSWAFLASFGLGVLLEMNSANYWMFLVGPCTLAPFLDAFFKRDVRAMIRRVTIVILLLTPVLIVQRLPIIVSNFRTLEIIYHTFVTY
jgi:hypothetical protein